MLITISLFLNGLIKMNCWQHNVASLFNANVCCPYLLVGVFVMFWRMVLRPYVFGELAFGAKSKIGACAVRSYAIKNFVIRVRAFFINSFN